MESGKVQSLTQIAEREEVNNSHVNRMANLTSLAPNIVEAILEGALLDHLKLFDLAVDPPAFREEQQAKLADAFLGSKNASASLT